MPHTGLDPVTFAYLSLSLPSSRGVRSGLFSKPLYRVLLGFKKSVKENEKKNLKYLCKHIGKRIASFTKKRNAGCFSFRWWSLEKSTHTQENFLLYVRVTACKGEREKRKKGFRRLHPCCLSFVLSLYKNNSLKNGVPFRVY